MNKRKITSEAQVANGKISITRKQEFLVESIEEAEQLLAQIQREMNRARMQITAAQEVLEQLTVEKIAIEEFLAEAKKKGGKTKGPIGPV